MADNLITTGIRITGDNADAIAALRQTTVEAQRMAGQVSSSSKAFGSSFITAAQDIKAANAQTLGAIRGVLGQVGLVAGAGIAAGKALEGSINLVNTALEDGADRARKFATAIQNVSADNLKKTGDEIARLKNLLAEAESNGFNAAGVFLGADDGARFGDTTAKIREQIEELERLQKVQAAGIARQKFDNEKNEADKAAKEKGDKEREENKRTTEQLSRDRDALLLETLDNEERVREEGQQRLREAYSKLDSARTDEQKRLAQEVIDLEYERLDRAYSELRAKKFKEEQEAQKKLQDDEKKHLKEVKDIRLQTEREVAALREDLERGFSRTDLTFYQNDEVLSELRRNTRATERLGF